MKTTYIVTWNGYTTYHFTDAKLAMAFADYWDAELKWLRI